MNLYMSDVHLYMLFPLNYFLHYRDGKIIITGNLLIVKFPFSWKPRQNGRNLFNYEIII